MRLLQSGMILLGVPFRIAILELKTAGDRKPDLRVKLRTQMPFGWLPPSHAGLGNVAMPVSRCLGRNSEGQGPFMTSSQARDI